MTPGLQTQFRKGSLLVTEGMQPGVQGETGFRA